MKPLGLIVLLFAFVIVLCSFWELEKLPSTSQQLGEKLFFDPLLSSDYTVSCSSCHRPEYAFSDNTPFSRGVNSNLTPRNTPSIMYMSSRISFFWDGRSRTLEEQALVPLTNPKEMNMTVPEVMKRIGGNSFYQRAFVKVFKQKPTIENICVALSDYQKSLAYHDSPYDHYLRGEKALSESALRGMTLFFFKGQCGACHIGNDFTNDEMRNIGLFNLQKYADAGRFSISKDSLDLGKFKTPHLRNIALTAPYMHDGSMKTLREVIEYYNDPEAHVEGIVNLDAAMKDSGPLDLTEEEITDLEAFLVSLTDYKFSRK